MLYNQSRSVDFYMMSYTVCFIGHRKIEQENELRTRLNNLVEDLIVMGARRFLFGSKSEFNSLCYEVVTKFKEKYLDIVRVCYTCKSESCFFKEEKEKWEKILSKTLHSSISINTFDEEVEFGAKYSAGRGGYVERNQAMIDDSDICVFYYNEKYLPPKRRQKKTDITSYQHKSGTKIAYNYALRKKKQIINLCELSTKKTN